MGNRKTSLLLPSAYRSPQLWSAAAAALDSTERPLEICVSVVLNDSDSIAIAHKLPVLLEARTFEEYNRGAVYAWNKLLKRASGDVIALWADDLVPEYGWLDHALAALDEMGGHGLVGLNDLSSDGEVYAAHWLADRRFIADELGGVMYPPMYKSWWCDREVTERAQKLGLYRWAKRAIVDHNNYTFGKSQMDRTYRDARENYEADRMLYETRKAAGYPLDWIKRETTPILPAQPQPAAPVASDNGKRHKSKVERSDRLSVERE
jgi:glycosyltransferase involved in cell wall biosynthesis